MGRGGKKWTYMHRLGREKWTYMPRLGRGAEK